MMALGAKGFHFDTRMPFLQPTPPPFSLAATRDIITTVSLMIDIKVKWQRAWEKGRCF